MQETRDFGGKPHQEIFTAPTRPELEEIMDARLDELKAQGHTLTRRVPIRHLPGRLRNKLCTCGSGKKVKKCCALNVQNSGEKA